jgi:hypothetical protein
MSLRPASQGRSRASAPSPALHAPYAPLNTRPFPAVRWSLPFEPATRQLVRQPIAKIFCSDGSLPFALTHLRVPIALASSAAGILADWRRCLSPNRDHPSGDPPAATAVAISADDRPDNCSIERRPTSCSSTQARPAPDLNARNHKRTANSRASARQSIAPCSGLPMRCHVPTKRSRGLPRKASDRPPPSRQCHPPYRFAAN